MKFVWSLPNILTYLRIVAVPAVVAAFYIEGDTGRWLAFGLFAAASITDYFDGYLARLWKQQSTLGRMLDPIADKLWCRSACWCSPITAPSAASRCGLR